MKANRKGYEKSISNSRIEPVSSDFDDVFNLFFIENGVPHIFHVNGSFVLGLAGFFEVQRSEGVN